MPAFYTDGQRSMQQQFQTTKMADLLQEAIVHAEVQEAERTFIESRDMFFLATVDDGGQPTCSYKGGDPGFVRVLDPKTLAFPIYDGNGMFLSLGNLATTAKVGMLFIDFETPHRLRVQGVASVDRSDPLLGQFTGADALVRVAVSEIFVNCSRYVHRYQRVAASRYVPRAGCEAP
ncbi:MAG TPA: pyridoxamine 5'-phosphate oxidase family protein, partial [Gemmatimonadales bacterium]|nr:pyridoxamine 5'-phosphate oxidase family protein [Gemmatimonadales bacterium]